METQTVYTSIREIQENFSFRYLHSLRFITLSVKDLLRKKYQKIYSQEDFSYERWLGSYFESEIKTKRFPPIYIQRINDELGYGVFASEKLPKNYWIGEYTGIVYKRTLFFKHNYYCMAYLREQRVFPKFCIDGEEMGNFTRLINHFDQPNLKLQTVFSKDLPHMGLITLREIQKNEQLSFDYGKEYWKQCRKTPLSL